MTELLDLSTVVERDTIRLRTKKNRDGKLYEFVNMEELGPFEYETIFARHAKVAGYAKLKRKLKPVEQRELNKSLGDILKLIVVDLEPSVLAEIEETQRARIVTAWALKFTTGAAEGEAPAGLTTAGSSRASKRSTAATRRRGSTSRASR